MKKGPFKMKGYTYPGTSPMQKNGDKNVIDKLHAGFEKSADEMNKRTRESKTITGGLIDALGGLPANLGEITTRFVKKGVDYLGGKKKKKNK